MASVNPFRGYRFLLGPEQLSVAPGQRVKSPAEYLAWHTCCVTERGGLPWDSPRPTRARVNHGRWIADCAWCKTGMFTRPEWGVAYCAECGARYRQGLVKYPENHREIEAALLIRIRRDQQNWDSRQELGDLARENRRLEVAAS